MTLDEALRAIDAGRIEDAKSIAAILWLAGAGRAPHRSSSRGTCGTLAVPPWELAFRSALIYFAMIVVLRLFGKREIGQFTLFDLVLILLVANAVSRR